VGRLIWPILIIAAVTVGLVVSAAGAETRAQIEYLSRIHGGATELSKNGAALRDLVTRLRTTSRTEFVAVIEAIQADLEVSITLANEDPPTASVIPVRVMFRQAVEAWDRGVSQFSEAILHAADWPNDNTALDMMTGALVQLRAGDALYGQLLLETERDDVPGPLTPLPTVIMTPADGGLVTLSLLYVDSARSPNNTLGLRPGLSVSQIVSDPPWQVDVNDQVVVSTTEEMVFSVVMTNVGNVGSQSQQVVLVLEGGPEPVQLNQWVEPLQPGLQVTLVYEPIAVVPGLLYEVAASIVVTADDFDLEDNIIRIQFTVSES
jgi:hypothetical protein